jgi:hypothetical protein
MFLMRILKNKKFNIEASIEESSFALITNKLYVLMMLVVLTFACANHLACLFSNVSFLAKQNIQNPKFTHKN